MFGKIIKAFERIAEAQEKQAEACITYYAIANEYLRAAKQQCDTGTAHNKADTEFIKEERERRTQQHAIWFMDRPTKEDGRSSED